MSRAVEVYSSVPFSTTVNMDNTVEGNSLCKSSKTVTLTNTVEGNSLCKSSKTVTPTKFCFMLRVHAQNKRVTMTELSIKHSINRYTLVAVLHARKKSKRIELILESAFGVPFSTIRSVLEYWKKATLEGRKIPREQITEFCETKKILGVTD